MASDIRNWDDEEESIINFVPKAPSNDNFSPLPYPEDSLGLEPKPLAQTSEETLGIQFNDMTSLAPPPKSAGFPPLPGRIPLGMPPLPTAVYSNSYASARAVVKPLPPAETQLTDPEPIAAPELEPSIFPDVLTAQQPDAAPPVIAKKSGKKSQPLPVAGLKEAPASQSKTTPIEAETPQGQSSLPPSESLLTNPAESKIETKSDSLELPEREAFSTSQENEPELASHSRVVSKYKDNEDYNPPTIMDVPLLHEHEMQRIAEYNPVMQVPVHSVVFVEALELIDPKTENIERATLMTPDSEHIPEVGMFVMMKTPTARTHQIFRLETAKMELGRSFDASIFIDDRAISMRHAAIRYEKNADVFDFVLYDLASTNGTFVNSQRVSKAVLNDDDIIEIGESVLVFKRVKELVPKV